MTVFNKTFYPTPVPLIRKMIEGLDLGGVYLLDPSGGDGAILDYLTKTRYDRGPKEVYAIEIDPDLRAILKEKGYAVLASDFLTYTPTLQFNVILMNPPFNQGLRHLIHAWEILTEGEIVCILPETSLEGKTGYEELVLKLIADNGKIEDAGKAFTEADRTTSVEVVIVRLTKKSNLGKMEWEVHNDQEIPKFEELPDTEIAIAGFVNGLLGNFKAAIGNYEAYSRERGKIVKYTEPFGCDYNGRESVDPLKEADYQDTAAGRYNTFVNHLQSAAWSKILDHPNFQKTLTERARKMMTEFRQSQRRLDFNEANIRSMFQELIAKQGQFIEAVILDAFDNMTMYYKENRIHFEGWSTNDCWRVNRRVILPNRVECGYGGALQVNYSYRAGLVDIDRAMCIVSNTDFDKIITAVDAVRMASEQHLKYARSTFFFIRFYKKGTVHLTFEDQEVWKKFNYMAARARKWLPPGQTEKEFHAANSDKGEDYAELRLLEDPA